MREQEDRDNFRAINKELLKEIDKRDAEASPKGKRVHNLMREFVKTNLAAMDVIEGKNLPIKINRTEPNGNLKSPTCPGCPTCRG